MGLARVRFVQSRCRWPLAWWPYGIFTPPQRGRRHMDQQLPLANIITLGVRDFAREREFYRRLGWPHAFDSDSFTVFELRGALLALFGIDQLGTDARATPEAGNGGIRRSVIITVDPSPTQPADPTRGQDAKARFRARCGRCRLQCAKQSHRTTVFHPGVSCLTVAHHAPISARRAAPSLVRMWVTWAEIVLGASTSCSAI